MKIDSLETVVNANTRAPELKMVITLPHPLELLADLEHYLGTAKAEQEFYEILYTEYCHQFGMRVIEKSQSNFTGMALVVVRNDEGGCSIC